MSSRWLDSIDLARYGVHDGNVEKLHVAANVDEKNNDETHHDDLLNLERAATRGATVMMRKEKFTIDEMAVENSIRDRIMERRKSKRMVKGPGSFTTENIALLMQTPPRAADGRKLHVTDMYDDEQEEKNEGEEGGFVDNPMLYEDEEEEVQDEDETKVKKTTSLQRNLSMRLFTGWNGGNDD